MDAPLTSRQERAVPYARALRWLPALAATAYVATVAVEFPVLVRALNWNTDASASFVLADQLRGHGPVYIPHFGWWTSMWWLLATRDLPGHEQLWEATGYAFALLGAGLLGWATARVAGRWAGVTAAATSLIVGPFALQALLTVNFHVSTPFTAALLCAYLVLLARSPSPILAAVIGLVAGMNAASDPLLWVAGIAPFALGALVLVASTRRGDIAVRAGITLGLTVVAAVTTNVVMHSLGFHLLFREFHPAHLTDLFSNTLHLGRVVALLGGANYVLPGGYPREPLRLLVALLAATAVAAAIVAALKQIGRRSDPTTRAFASYWAAATILLGISLIGTTNATAQGAGSINYVLTLALAAGAGVALLAAGSWRAQVAAALGIAVVGAVNIAGIVQHRAGTPRGVLVRNERALVRLLESKGVTRGYAGYWEAQNLSWQTDMRLFISPVIRCHVASSGLCADKFFVIRSWYDERPGPSFLIVDPKSQFVSGPPDVVSEATGAYRFGRLTVYIFPYDLARHIRPPSTSSRKRT